MKRNTIFWIIIIAVGVLLFTLGTLDNNDNPEPSVSPTPTPTSIITPTPTPKINPTATPDDSRVPFEGFPDQDLVGDSVPYDQLPAVATCNLSGGEIVFSSPGVAINNNAYIEYIGVDHPGRLFFWSTSPETDGELSIGPSIFSNLTLPDGQKNILVVNNTEDLAKEYKITASINYGRMVDGWIEMFTAQCSGEITVKFDYL